MHSKAHFLVLFSNKSPAKTSTFGYQKVGFEFLKGAESNKIRIIGAIPHLNEYNGIRPMEIGSEVEAKQQLKGRRCFFHQYLPKDACRKVCTVADTVRCTHIENNTKQTVKFYSLSESDFT